MDESKSRAVRCRWSRPANRLSSGSIIAALPVMLRASTRASNSVSNLAYLPRGRRSTHTTEPGMGAIENNTSKPIPGLFQDRDPNPSSETCSVI